jgi:hypothetical protein
VGPEGGYGLAKDFTEVHTRSKKEGLGQVRSGLRI